MSARDKLLHILEYTASDVVDDLYPDVSMTLDDIAGMLLEEHAHELAEEQRAERDRQYGPLEFKAEKIAINRVVDLIDPEVQA